MTKFTFPCSRCTRNVEETCEGLDNSPLARRIYELLSTNEAPLDIERRSCSAYVKEREAFLHELDSKIEKLQTMLVNLQHARSMTSEHLTDYKTVIHPLRRLPPEILAEIFSFCVQDSTSSDIFLEDAVSSLVTGRAPWSLAQVCSRWRSVCLSLPSIWSNITLHFEATPRAATNPHQRKALTFLLGHQLARSGNHPLSVNLISPDTFPQDHFLLPLLLPSSSRWRQLIAKTSTRSFDCLAPIEGFLQSLEVLILHSRGRPTNDEPRTLFRYAPNLRKVITYTQTALGLHFPYETITEFRNFDVEPAQGSRTTNNLEILRRFQWLNSLKLNCRTDGMQHHVCVMHHLTHIELCGELSSNGVSALLSNLRLPALRSLHLIGKLDLDKIITFLSQSKCELVELAIKSAILSGEECFSFLERVPGIEKLTLSSSFSVITAVLSELGQDVGDLDDTDDDTMLDVDDPDLTIISNARPSDDEALGIVPRLKVLEILLDRAGDASSDIMTSVVKMVRRTRPGLKISLQEQVRDDILVLE